LRKLKKILKQYIQQRVKEKQERDDHILQHDLVQENPIAAEFVSTMEKEMQNIKESFNTKMMSILGSKIGQDNELCFPSFKNKKQKVIDKGFKGYGG
jgi:hypothetical protein